MMRPFEASASGWDCDSSSECGGIGSNHFQFKKKGGEFLNKLILAC